MRYKAEIEFDGNQQKQVFDFIDRIKGELTNYRPAEVPGLTLVQKTFTPVKEVHRKLPGQTQIDLILDCFKKNEKLKIADISRRTGLSSDNIAQALWSLFKQGRLTRSGTPGAYLYELP